jgi:glyoxylase-like metal-dependent hydrolase (beta-lactamase superfamily II)
MDPERSARYRVGGCDLTVISDGVFFQDAGVIMGIVPRSVWEPAIGPPTERNLKPVDLNSLLIRSMGKTILVDTGIGAKLNAVQRERYFPGYYGHLLRRLRALGVQPDEVDAVVNSHLHFDHCGWNTADVHGQPLPTFPRATYYIQRGEYETATHPNERTRATYLQENFAPLAENGQLALVEGEHAITPEVRIVPTPGHTADHCSVVVASGGETAVFLGEMAQHAVQLERLPWISSFDIFPLVSMETKRTTLDRAVRDQSLVVSVHAAFPGVGRMRDENGRRSFVPVPPDDPDVG